MSSAIKPVLAGLASEHIVLQQGSATTARRLGPDGVAAPKRPPGHKSVAGREPPHGTTALAAVLSLPK